MKILKIIISLLNLTGIGSFDSNENNPYDNYRLPRCTDSEKMESFLTKTVNLVERSKSELENAYDVSKCLVNSSREYIRHHILNGLIVQDDLPVTHWHEYKVSLPFIYFSL